MFSSRYSREPWSAEVELLGSHRHNTLVRAGSSPVCLLEKGTVICVCVCVRLALWVTCLMCDRCVTGMCSGQVTGEIPLGDSERLPLCLSHTVFFGFHPSFSKPLAELIPRNNVGGFFCFLLSQRCGSSIIHPLHVSCVRSSKPVACNLSCAAASVRVCLCSYIFCVFVSLNM